MSALAQASCQLTRSHRRHLRAAVRRPRSRTKYTYDANGNAITRNGQTIGWTSYNLPNLINATGESSTFTYGPRHEKWTQVYTGPSGTETTTYYGNLLETVVTSAGTDWRHYIFAGSEQVAIYSRTSGGTNTLRYTLEDHLGSPSAITSSTGTLLVNENFTAYGSQRNPTIWSGAPPPGDLTTIAGITRQGYTGQTMLGNMGLIHMNGRVMDAITGRFLSADPYISEPGNTQNFNRYGYVYNNPLSYVDPSGFDTTTTLTGSIIPGEIPSFWSFVGSEPWDLSTGAGTASRGGNAGADTAGRADSGRPSGAGSAGNQSPSGHISVEEVAPGGFTLLGYTPPNNHNSFTGDFTSFFSQQSLWGGSSQRLLPKEPADRATEETSQALTGTGALYSVGETLAGDSRLGTNGKIYGPNFFANKTVSTVKAANVFRGAAGAAAAAGVVFDVVRFERGDISAAHALSNTVIEIGMWAAPEVMVPIGGVYFTIEGYSGGPGKALSDYSATRSAMHLTPYDKY